MRDLLRLVDRRQAALAIALGVGVVLCGAALLATSGALITSAANRPETLLALMPMITGVRLFALSRAGFRYSERLISHDLTLRLVGRLRTELLRRLVPLAPAALTGARGGELLARIRTDVDELQGVWVRLVAPTVVAVLAGGIATVLVALVSAPLALVLLALLLLLGAVVPAWSVRAGRPPAVDAAREDAAYGADLLDLVRGLGDHLGSDGGRTALAGLDRHLERQLQAERTTARITALTTFARDGVPAIGVVAALWLVGWDVTHGATNPVLLAAAALGVLGAFEAVGGLGQAWAAAGGMRAAADRVRALGAQSPAVFDARDPLPLPASPTLRFDDVTVAYPGADRNAVSHVSLEVAAREKVALVGPSGAGKSTLLALAVRSRDPDAGRVSLGGVGLGELALTDVRAASAWEAQSPQILGGSVASNLRLARPDAGDEELGEVLRAVGLGAVVDTGRLDAWVGESGQRLSAGERARVAVARALLSPAPRILLDEPTAHLDQASARALLDLLAGLNRSVVVVTHRAEDLDARWRTVPLDPAG